MPRFLRPIVALAALLAVSTVGLGLAAAQEVDGAFSDTLIHGLGYSEVIVVVGPDGIVAPSELPTGPYVVTLDPSDDHIGYLVVVQVPEGLGAEELERQALAAGTGDMPQPGWDYVGGTNTAGPGETASFILDLAPGNYHWAASFYAMDGSVEEIIRLAPFSVSEDEVTPAAEGNVPAEPPATVTLEETDDLRYVLSPDPVPAGPQIWKIANTGRRHAHHVVMMRAPEGTTANQIVEEFTAQFAAMETGTPMAGEPLMARMTWVGYAALQSGGRTTWVEFNLEPATYAVVCFILDPATGQPHLTNGMATVFEVT